MESPHRPKINFAVWRLAIVPLVALILWGTGVLVHRWQSAHHSVTLESTLSKGPAAGDPAGALDPASLAKNGGGGAAPEQDLHPSPADRPIPYRTAEARIKTGSTVGHTLTGLGLTARDVAQMIRDVKETKDLARVAAGTLVTAVWQNATDHDPDRVEMKLSDTKTLLISRISTAEPADAGDSDADDAVWRADVKEEIVVRRAAAFAGVVTSNLWASATMAGMDPMVITRMTEIFAWQIDFNREVQLDDRWRLTVEQLFVNGKSVGFGDIIAAEYENSGDLHTAIRFNTEGRNEQYFQPDGSSLRRMFLKSPLKFGRITSGFSAARFHPILKYARPHNGVDYGAPIGTPIMSVGSGTVSVAGPRGPSGNMVTIRHNAVYETNYKHMSAFAAGIKTGSKVEMGQVIGYVGQTGLATGPHLHFEFHENGQYVDPQGLKFPAADPVAASEQELFRETARQALGELPPWSKALLTAKKPAAGQAAAATSE